MSLLAHFITRPAQICMAFVLGTLVMSGATSAFAETHNCWCEIKCSSSQTGQSFTQSEQSVGTPFGWPITAAKHDQCSNRCLGLVQDQGKAVADAGKLCKTGNCSGKSWIGTGTGGPRMTVSNVDFDNSSKPYCQGPGPDGNPCCPEFTKAIKPASVKTMFAESDHELGKPYTITFNSNGSFSDAFEGYLKEWAHWLNVDGCRGVVGFSISYQLFNTNSTVKPTGPNPPAGSTAPLQTQVVTYINGNVSPPSYVWNIPASPNWWFVKATATPIGKDGKPVVCAKTTGCMDRIFTGWIDDALTMAKVAPGGPPQQGKLRILD